jgi:parallel beta-helix repeat protein
MPLRILDSDGRGNEFLIAEAIHYAVANGAEVINLSLGMSADSELIEDIIEDTVDAGVVIVAAAGNLNSSTEQYPAANENVLAVTAVGPTYAKSSFANYGAWVDIATPGESITSTFPIDGYARWSGTSMATSFVSGQATLIRSVSPTMPVADVAWLIRSTARPLDDFNPGHQGLLGAGLADIGATLRQGISGVSCGQVLTTSVVVANNLTDCPGDGLVIGAAGITVDLNGRTIDGVGLGSGIRNDGFDSVTITNGTVQEFDVGVYLNAGAALNTVSSLTLQLNQEAGIQLSAAGNGNTIQANTIAGNATGLVLSDSTGAVIAANTVTGNSGYCLHLLNASGNVLEANLFTGSSDLAVFLEGANGNTLIGNTITDSSDSALLLQGASGTHCLAILS